MPYIGDVSGREPEPAVSQKALEQAAAHWPDRSGRRDVWLIAEEPERWVVAVVFFEPMSMGRQEYELLAVRREDLTTETLPGHPDSPYSITGWK